MDGQSSPTDLINSQSATSVIIEMARCFNGAVSVRESLHAISNRDARILRVSARKYQSLLRIIFLAGFAHLRINLWRRARFTFNNNARTVNDPVPLRFLIPFIFCEPRGRWYKYAPFFIKLYTSPKRKIIADVFIETSGDYLGCRGQIITSISYEKERPYWGIGIGRHPEFKTQVQQYISQDKKIKYD